MTGTTISGSYLNSVTLSVPATQNPATIAIGATISNANGTYTTALYGASPTIWTIQNYGTIEGFGGNGSGVSLAAGGIIANHSSGTITGTNHGIALTGSGTVTNRGSIYGGNTGTNPGAIYLTAGGYVANLSGGVISAADDGIVLSRGGTVTNQSDALITASGAAAIAGVGGATTIVNSGRIADGNGPGISLVSGSVTNQSGGTISGSTYGIVFSGGPGTVVNAGSISSGNTANTAVSFAAAFANRFVIDPGAASTGTINDGGTLSTLELASGSSNGTISGLGAKFTGFGQVDVDSGATWIMSGSDTVAADVTLTNNGTLAINGTLAENGLLSSNAGPVIVGSGAGAHGTITVGDGTLSSNGQVIVGKSGTGLLTVNAGGSVIADGGFTIGQSSGGNGTVVVNGGTLSAISPTDSAVAFIVGNSAAGTLTIESGTVTATQSPGPAADIGLSAAGTGIATVTGTASLWQVNGQLIIGDSGHGSLDVNGGGIVNGSSSIAIGNQSGGSGTVSVETGGTLIGEALWVAAPGSGAASGTLTVGGGGTVEVTSVAAGSGGTIAVGGGTVAASLSDTGQMMIGQSGTGALLSIGSLGVVSGTSGSVLSIGNFNTAVGTVTVNDGTLSGFGGFNINDGVLSVTAGGLLTVSNNTTAGSSVGFNAGSAGTLVVNGGTLAATGESFSIGGSNAVGSLLVEGGGLLTTTADSEEYAQAGAIDATGTGAALAVVSGGTWDANGAVSVASFPGGTGSLDINNSGLVNAGTNNISIANQSSSSGTVSVESGGTLIGGVLYIANTVSGSATGSLVIGSGGTAELSSLTAYDGGTITVGGTQAAVLTSTGGITIGQSGSGTAVLAIDSDGTVTQTGTSALQIGLSGIGGASGGDGSLIIDGGTLTDTGQFFTVGGSNAVGSLVVEAGGLLITTPGSFGNAGDISASGTGAASGTISNATWTLNGNLTVGDSGTGSLDINSNGLVNAGTNSITIGNQAGSSGTISIESGTLEGASLAIANGGIGASSGLLSIGGAGTVLVGSATVSQGGGVLLAGRLLDPTSLSVAAGGTIGGYGKLDAVITNAGTIAAAGGTLTMTGTVDGSGTMQIAANATLVLDSIVTAGQTIEFGGTSAALQIGATGFSGTIDGFLPTTTISPGDSIVLAGVSDVTAATILGGNTLQIVQSSGPDIDLQFDPTQDFSSELFHATNDSSNDSATLIDVPCFADGTRLATPSGPVAVEALRIGDIVCTASGALRGVRWIGSRRVDIRRHPSPDRVLPIRIEANAFTDGAPRRPLRLSPDHAVLLDGVLIPIHLLRNDASITRESDCSTVTYYHVELDVHDIVLAEGLAAESYLDTGNRGMFANARGPLHLHPDFANDQARREMESCAPFVADAARVEPIWRRLAMRASALGYPLPEDPETTTDPALLLATGDRLIKPLEIRAGCYLFALPHGLPSVRLVSRAAVPSERRPWIEDRRRLGVVVSRLTIRSGDMVHAVPVDHPMLRDGWWDVERHGTATLRWTDGDAELPLLLQEPSILEVTVAGTLDYPLARPLPARAGMAAHAA